MAIGDIGVARLDGLGELPFIVKWHGDNWLNIQFTASPERQQAYRARLCDRVSGVRAA